MTNKKQVHLRANRIFSESFRKERVKEYESGRHTVLEISRLYGISDVTVYKWIYRYSTYNKKGYKVVEEKNSGRNRVQELLERVADLERALGQKQIKVDYLETLLEAAGERYGTDLKKTSDGGRSK